MKSCILDCDDFLYNISESAIIKYNYISLQKGLPFRTNVWDFNSNLDLNMSAQEFFDDMIILNSLPMYSAVETVKELAKTFNIVYLTARGHIKDAFNLTKESLLKHGFPLTSDDNLIIVDMAKKKIDVIKELGLDCAYAGDDNAKHIADYHDSGLFEDLFLMDRPWNKDYPHLNRYRIFEVKDILKRIVVGGEIPVLKHYTDQEWVKLNKKQRDMINRDIWRDSATTGRPTVHAKECRPFAGIMPAMVISCDKCGKPLHYNECGYHSETCTAK